MASTFHSIVPFCTCFAISITASQFVGRPDTLTVNTESDNGTISPQSLDISYCVGALIPSTHPNPISNERPELEGCALSCSSGSQTYGLSDDDQRAVELCTEIGSVLCFLGLIILSLNLYFDSKHSKESFCRKPLLFHIPYVITGSCFVLSIMMAGSTIFGKEGVICFHGEYSLWNPIDGKSASCTLFGILFYFAITYYALYVLLLSFVVWRQFKNPIRPLFMIDKKWYHIAVFVLVFIMTLVSLITSTIDAIEPMGVCFPGVADKYQFLGFVVMPLSISFVFSGIFLIWSSVLVKVTAENNKQNVNAESTQNMQDLFKRILVYAFGVLFTLALLLATGIIFYMKHDDMRKGLSFYVECELQNALSPLSNANCKALRARDYETISPFWFISWVLCCLVAVIAQIVLSFHNKARRRADKITSIIKQKTMEVVGTPMVAMSSRRLPKLSSAPLVPQQTLSTDSVPIVTVPLSVRSLRTSSSNMTSAGSTALSTGSGRGSTEFHGLRSPSSPIMTSPEQAESGDELVVMEVIEEDHGLR